jgi:GNAT superfamily N-acetyltransferase
MLQEDRERFGPTPADLKDGRRVTLRLLDPADAEALGEFFESVPREDCRFYSPYKLTRLKAAERAADSLHACSILLVAEDEGRRIVGIATCDWKDAHSPSGGFGLCVRRGFQGVGLGGRLMARLLEIAAQVGPPVVTLTVQLANPRAVALYRKMGFRVVREQVRGAVDEFPPEPEFLMQRRMR